MLLVQKLFLLYTSKLSSFQYIICCWFNSPLMSSDKKFSRFQYIICCWFKYFKGNSCRIIRKFQYIICCWFKINSWAKSLTFCQFQYIICCWFNNYSKKICIIYSISIHYMLLVQSLHKWLTVHQTIISIHYMLLVQTNKNTNLSQNYLFQYIICCWFNQPRAF